MNMRIGVVWLALLVAAPLSAQNVNQVRPMMAPKVSGVVIDYQQEWEKERAKNQALRAEVADLRGQLASWTNKGGSQVRAYCETPTVSRNSAGASNDCAASGFACEQVSGLCRTRANSSSDCAGGFIYCATNNQCVRDAGGCP